MTSPMTIIPKIQNNLSLPVLRDYQESCRQHVLAAVYHGRRSVHFDLPTGTGKSVVLGSLAADFRAYGRVIAIAHLRELIGQLEGHMQAWCGPDAVGVVMGQQDHPEADVVVASVQTLARGRLAKILADPRPIAALMVDEMHHSTAATYRAIIEAARQHSPNVAIVGCSATPFRSDKQSSELADLFPICAFERSIDDMQTAGWLAPLTYSRVEVPLELRDIAVRIAGDGESDYAYGALSLAARHPEVIRILVAATIPEIGSRLTLAFCAGVQHAQTLAAAYHAAGIHAAAVDGSMSPVQRSAILDDWRTGEIQVICQDSLLGEGFDFPDISALVLAAPTASLVRYIQRLGRGTRLAPGKIDCLVLEATPGRPDDRQITLGCVTPVLEDAPRPKPGPRNPKLVMIDPRHDAHWRWLQVQPGIFVAPVDQNRAVWLVRDPDRMGSGLYRAAVLDGDQISPLTGSSVPATRPLRDLQQQAANYLKDHAYLKLAGQDMGWHRTPASEKQAAVLWRWGEMPAPDLTRGEASELITLHIARRKARLVASQLWPEVERQAANG